MKLPELVGLAAEAFDPSNPALMLQYFTKNGEVLAPRASQQVPEPDGLARFLLVELVETHDPEASDAIQRDQAFRVMSTAAEQVSRVRDAFARTSDSPQ